jgi:hypothetical protein
MYLMLGADIKALSRNDPSVLYLPKYAIEKHAELIPKHLFLSLKKTAIV